MRIAAVVKDPGGMHAVLPVVAQLRALGHAVVLYANGVSMSLLCKAHEEFVTAACPQDILRDGPPDILLTSMCSEGGVGRDVIPLLSAHPIRVVAVQDQWGARLLTDWKDETFRPDYLAVNDMVARDIVGRAWPDFDASRVWVLGYASLDALAHFDRSSRRSKVRDMLGLEPNVPVVYFSGQLVATSAALQELVAALENISYVGRVIAAKHPRMQVDNPTLASEARLWESTVALQRQWFVELPGERPEELDLIAASDVVVGMFPTALMHAAALRVPAISVMYPDSPMHRQYRAATGGLMNVHPLVELGAVACAQHRADLAQLLQAFQDSSLAAKLLPQQIANLKVDGGNAKRIAQKISSLA